jgi:hypothetical protein
MMFDNSLAMLASGFLIGRGKRRTNYSAMTLVLFSILLAIAGEFGILELVTLLIDLPLLWLLIDVRSTRLAPLESET